MFDFLKAVCLMLVIAPFAFAAAPKTITLDLKLQVNDQTITQPKMIVTMGKKSTTLKVLGTDKSTYVIEVTSNQDVDQQVYLNFTLSEVKNGKSFVIAHPRMITLFDQEAVIEEGDSATSDAKNVILRVTPHS